MPSYKLLKDAYYGEGGFIDGQYLEQHGRETTANYEKRKAMAYYYNYFAAIVNALVDPIFRKTPGRSWPDTGTAGTLISAFVDNVDNQGTKLNAFMADAAMKAQQQPGVGQALHIAAHRLHRHVQALRQPLDGDGAPRPHLIKQGLLTRVGAPGGGRGHDGISRTDTVTHASGANEEIATQKMPSAPAVACMRSSDLRDCRCQVLRARVKHTSLQ